VDTNIIFNGERVANSKSAGYFPIYKKEDFKDNFFLQFRDKKRWLRPDCVYSMQSGTNKSELVKFEDIMQVIIKFDDGNRVNFTVRPMIKPIDQEKFKLYRLFCSNLKTVPRINGTKFGDEFRGFKYGEVFEKYPKAFLEKQITIMNQLLNPSVTGKAGVISLDWKYMGEKSFIENNKKIANDITKQLCYEFVLKQLLPNFIIQNQFVIPSQADELVSKKILHSRISNNAIQVFKANFKKIQNIYLTHD
jgi:hypothetical protein